MTAGKYALVIGHDDGRGWGAVYLCGLKVHEGHIDDCEQRLIELLSNVERISFDWPEEATGAMPERLKDFVVPA